MNQTARGILHPDVSPDDHSTGPDDAPVTLVEYGDFQCPWCYRAQPIVAALQQQFGEGMRFVFRNFPLSEIHPNARHAAEAAESVNASSGPEAYWQMHHEIFAHQQDDDDALDDTHLCHYAADVGADPRHVQHDLDTGRFTARVMADFSSGARSGVNGTPTFFINGRRFEGNWSNPSEFVAALERAARSAVPRVDSMM